MEGLSDEQRETLRNTAITEMFPGKDKKATAKRRKANKAARKQRKK